MRLNLLTLTPLAAMLQPALASWYVDLSCPGPTSFRDLLIDNLIGRSSIMKVAVQLMVLPAARLEAQAEATLTSSGVSLAAPTTMFWLQELRRRT